MGEGVRDVGGGAALQFSRSGPSVGAFGRVVEFLKSYRVAWAARRAGDADALFPHGTYLLRVLHDAPCAGAG